MFFIWINVYTQLNVYIWMYLRNSRTVLKLVKSSVGKQGRKCLPFSLALWSSPLPEQLETKKKRKEKHTPHTYKYTRIQIVKCPTHNIPETIFKQLSVNKQTPTYNSEKIDADENYRCSSPWLLSLVIFAILCLLRERHYVFTSVILKQSNIYSTLQVDIVSRKTVW